MSSYDKSSGPASSTRRLPAPPSPPTSAITAAAASSAQIGSYSACPCPAIGMTGSSDRRPSNVNHGSLGA